ncbi:MULTISPECIES: hypothetical protein [Sphingobium]|uniref:hypothetical protein n=1 Tax=Sphingobium sp. MI1205 TaxID=407020 RepID=UPI0011A841B8|nr:hypothetical protein [Sphingobium sp. MI1205]
MGGILQRGEAMEREHTEFLRLLAGDVQHALDLAALSASPTDRRNLLRTIISAAEGISWIYRVHVLSVAKEFDATTPFIEMALAEASFSVSEQGEIVEQARYTSLTAIIRLTTRIAQSICPDLDVDFGGVGWMHLKDAIKMRNRITHPKNIRDLAVSEQEIEKAKLGFFWFLDIALRVMEETVKEFSVLVVDLKKLGQELRRGDPDALDLYRRAHRDSDD